MAKDIVKSKNLEKEALEYHQFPKPGKLSVIATKPMETQNDLSLAYSPGVAFACEAIRQDPLAAYQYTARSNLVAVITNGTAVLGLGAIGPLAAKPVMEGKAVLFKKFAGIDVFDLEINEPDPDKLIEIIASLEPTFGALNLEDIKAPECFKIEEALKKRLKIPVFHDDQHGTAIIVAAGILNGLKVVGKKIEEVKIVTSGAGAAALACLDLLVSLGVGRENIWVSDVSGVVYEGRGDLDNSPKKKYAQATSHRSLKDIMEGADVFLGLSAAGVVSQDMVRGMAPNPLIFALANPDPEIMPDKVKEVRSDAIIATGRTDYPNQINNVLCFPYIFRGALDVEASEINEEMKLACVHALANLAMAEPSDIVAAAYEGAHSLCFGPEYLIPKPFDPRLILQLAPAVAKAAMDSGVAGKPIEDFTLYRQQLSEFVFRSGLIMRPLFLKAKEDPKRIVYNEGEDEKVLCAVQTAVDEKMLHPILIGSAEVIKDQIHRLGLRLRPQVDFTILDPMDNPLYEEYWQEYYQLTAHKGTSPEIAQEILRSNPTLNAAIMLHRGEADGMLLGSKGDFHQYLTHVVDVIGLAPQVKTLGALSALVCEEGSFFICDTYVNLDPTAAQIAEITHMAADWIRRFGITPKVALLSHSNFGSVKSSSFLKMEEAVSLIREKDPDLEIEGAVPGEAAFCEATRHLVFPQSNLKGRANLLIMPNLDSANITFNVVKGLKYGLGIGPILLGTRCPGHILTSSTSVRGILNMSALAVVEAQNYIRNG
jgi:malate dehydrogenase (oxaloacetate-decarboxylating)(NADP+)